MVLFSHPMPELPDVTLYVEHLERLLKGGVLRKVRLASPFVLRSVAPPVQTVEGKRLMEVSRLGKRIVFSFEENLFLVLHLMISGRLKWKAALAPIPKKIGLLSLDFERGSLLLTEASPKKRAWLRVVAGEEALFVLDPGGLEPLEAPREAFSARLRSENHTLKRALPRLRDESPAHRLRQQRNELLPGVPDGWQTPGGPLPFAPSPRRLAEELRGDGGTQGRGAWRRSAYFAFW
jgi:hypothetical protein